MSEEQLRRDEEELEALGRSLGLADVVSALLGASTEPRAAAMAGEGVDAAVAAAATADSGDAGRSDAAVGGDGGASAADGDAGGR